MGGKFRTSAQLCVVRHAAAGSRQRWDGDDALRPLTAKGNRQAAEIAKRYVERCSRIESSPYLRCIETVSPLSRAASLRVQESELLAEGSDPEKALDWLVSQAATLSESERLVACTHGDLMMGFAILLERRGLGLDRRANAIEKGATIEFSLNGDELDSALYVAAPAGVKSPKH